MNKKVYMTKNILGGKMRVSWIKYKEDKKSFVIPKNLGFNVYEIDDLDNTDTKIKELIKQDYNTIILTNEVASFSEDIIKKYKNDKDINIIISS